MAALSKNLRPFLNAIRTINKIPFIESFLARRTQGKDLSNFWVKLLPPLHLYKRGSIRRVERNGIKYCLDLSDYIEFVIYFGLQVEPKKPLYDCVRDGMYVFDVGTNMGDTLLNFAKLNTKGKNFGFEPVPFLYEKAQKNIELNNFKNIHLNNLALSNQKGSLYFELPKNQNFGSISMSVHATRDSKEVKAVTLDEFIRDSKIEKVDLIKIDVEGFESNVLEGAKKTIQFHKPVLFIEVVDEYLKKNGSNATKLVQDIIRLGYHVTDADTNTHLTEASNIEGHRLDVICRPV